MKTTHSVTPEQKKAGNLYECMACGHRVKGRHPMVCPVCTGEMQNLSNARGQ